MVLFKLLLLFSSVVCVMAAAITKRAGCGEVNLILTGIPPYHPIVTQLGFDPRVVDAAIRADAANIIRMGYNLRVVLMGPEQDLGNLRNQMSGTEWQGTGVGFGIRGPPREDVTIRFTDILKTFRTDAPNAPILFDYSPTTFSWAVQREFSLPGDCQPGKDLGLQVICDICSGR